MMPVRTSEDRQIWNAFRYHSRTFSLAARLLPRRVRMPIATLYLFCRTVDTIADDHVLKIGADGALREVETTRAQLGQALAGRPGPEVLWQRLAEVHETFDLPEGPLHELLDGAVWDLTGRTVETEADLLHYSNLVGGSVGAMMLPFLVHDQTDIEPLEPRARALGNAMQVTNICRDVGEDLRRLNRIYLPQAWRTEYDICDAALKAEPLPDAYPALMERMMTTAERLYAESFKGIPGLRLAAQRGIAAAGRMYREILNEVRALNYNNRTRRAYVPFRRKLKVVMQDGYETRKTRLLGRSSFVVRRS